MSVFAQNFSNLDADSGKYSREDAGLESLTLDTRQAGKQRRRGHKISSVPSAIFSALFNYVEFIANFERKVGGRRGLEGVYADPKGNSR
jgi:hypothetical protein